MRACLVSALVAAPAGKAQRPSWRRARGRGDPVLARERSRRRQGLAPRAHRAPRPV